MRISIVNIGDEILIGQIVNTNAQWLAEEISKTGAEIVYHSAISDSRQEIFYELDKALEKSDIVILTGGLGPTSDDITKETLADYFNTELVENQDILDYLTSFFQKLGRSITDTNKSQALLPKDCLIIKNKVGTAPGMLFEKNGKYVFSLPGVPKEMQFLSEDFVFGFIRHKMEEMESPVMLYKTLKTFGIVEASLSDIIGNQDFLGKSSLAFLPSPSKGVRLRISVKAKNRKEGKKEIERIKAELYSRAGDYIFGEDNQEIMDVAGDLLKKNRLTVSVAESCTGGMLGAAFTDVSGSSSYFRGGMITYDNDVKIYQLGVNIQTIIDHGAVSNQCASEMALNIRKMMNTNIGIAITGVAGPTGGTSEKPVGTVWVGFAFGEEVTAKKFNFGNNRDFNRERAVAAAISILYNRLKDLK